MCRDPRLVVCCLSGLLLFCASIVLFCTGPLVYKYYNHAIGFKATRCSISTSTHGTTIQSCEGGCVPCTSFKVLYDDSEKMNNSVGLNKSQSIGYLNPDETSIRENGWCYPDPPKCCKDVNRTFDCFFNPNNKQEVIERRIFTSAGAINSLFWPLLAIVSSAVLLIFYGVIYIPSVDDVIKKGNVLHLKLIMRIRKFPNYRSSDLLRLSSTDRSTKCVKFLFNYYDYKQTELDDLLVVLCGRSVFLYYYSDHLRAFWANFLIELGANVKCLNGCGNTALHVAASAGHHECVVLLLQHSVDVNALNMKNYTPLMEACRNAPRPNETIRALINSGCDVNIRSRKGKTALHILSQRGMNLDLLLEAGADPNVRDDDGNTPLHVALSNGSCSSVNDLLNIQSENPVRTHTINVNVKNRDGCTPLMEACRVVFCPSKIIQALLHAGSDVNTHDSEAYTALRYAAENNNDLMPLLKFGADINLRYIKGNTILHIAASKGHLSGLKALLNAGNSLTSTSAKISVNVRNFKERTPLILACMNGHHSREIIETLVGTGSEVNTQDIKGKTALHYAAEYDLDLTPLLTFGADPNLRDYMGNTSLHVTASNGYLSCVTALLNAGNSRSSISAKVSVNARNLKERTPLILACMSGHHSEDIIETLVYASSEVNTQDIKGKTALHYAAEYDLDLLPLLKFGADPNLRDYKGNTSLHVTASKGHLSGVKALLNMNVPEINVNATNIDKQTPLIVACLNHTEEIIETLVNAGSNVNIKDDRGGTALFYVVQRDLNVSVLLENDADPFVRHSSGYTAFGMAVSHHRHDTTIELIRSNSVHLKIINTPNGWDMLAVALNKHSFAIARSLLIAGYDRASLLKWMRSLSLKDNWPDEEGADMEWMMECVVRHSSASLRHLSCLSIRRSINRRIVSSVEQLPLPRKLKDFVSLKELLSYTKQLEASLTDK